MVGYNINKKTKHKMGDESIFQNKSGSFLESIEALGKLSAARLTGYCCRVLEHLAGDDSGSPFTEQEEVSMAKKLKVENTRVCSNFLFQSKFTLPFLVYFPCF